jgi:biopolymer transport protein ExbB
MDILVIIQKSGVVGYTLLGLSVISTAIIIEKMFTLRISKLIPPDDVRLIVEFISDGNIADAVEVCKRKRGFISSIVLETLRNIGTPTKENFLSSFEVAARKKFLELERGMAFLATIASISPFLGLIGTVLGMIKIFGVLTAGTSSIGNPQQLSAGISEALLTTVMGLLIAIPATIAYNVFQKKLDLIATEVESIGVLIANNLK